MVVDFENGCLFQSSDSPSNCGTFPAGSQRSVFVEAFWQDGLPGSVTITDDCAGRQPDATSSFFATSWLAPNTPGVTCTTTVRATNLQGVSTEVAARYQLGAP